MWNELGIAFALILIIEGIWPFASPLGLRKMLLALAQLNDAQLRFAGISSMLIGVILLYILH